MQHMVFTVLKKIVSFTLPLLYPLFPLAKRLGGSRASMTALEKR